MSQRAINQPVFKKSKLASFKNELESRRSTLAKDLQQATADLINTEESYADSVDQASAQTDRTFILQLKNRERDELWQIDEALRRIEEGTFGECERCEETIAEARMRANPSTTLCIDCQAELESEKQRFPGRA
ncbi:TraR/DksA family transcriptional regulator [bacterium]|jgi:DnaK suppressor protein|nr:TraR/DksA family transcriptional regulator [bacterium]